MKNETHQVNRRSRLLLGGGILITISLGLFGFLLTPGCAPIPGFPQCTRILFIGNSYTSVNNLPGTFAKLAKSGGHSVETEMAAPGGWTLSDHAASPDTLTKLTSKKWDYVVLQEQSQIPAIEPFRVQGMYPASRQLVSKILEAEADPVFFLTWAHRDGMPDNGMPDYETMQAQIDFGYLQIAQELNARVAPAGIAWLLAREQNPQRNLWQDDGSHPNITGTYLAACVFYAVIFRQSPVGLKFTAGLPEETARQMQTTAADLVLQNPEQWHLP
jgi:hypothetical protein